MSEKIETFISEEKLKSRVKELGEQITKDYAGSDRKLLLIAILKGSVVFLSDLMRNIHCDLTIDFMVTSSYGNKTVSGGNVKIIKDLDVNVSQYDLLIVEDILDSGNTLSKVIEILKTRRPKSLKVCALLDKPERRQSPVELDYRGFEIPDEFVVGYGLDYDERFRNLPYIGNLFLSPDTGEK